MMVFFASACFLLLAYTYAGFPLLLRFLSRILAHPWKKNDNYRPTVSVILPAYNEGAVIERCLEALFAIDYPLDRIEILCGSDGSTDETNVILREKAIAHSNLKPFLFEERRGKCLVLNDLVSRATGEILYFVDADILPMHNALLKLVRHFADTSIGGVGGDLVLDSSLDSTIYSTERMFWSVDAEMRDAEAKISSALAMYGGNYALRRSLWTPLPSGQASDDFFSVLNVIAKGKRVVHDKEAQVVEPYGRNAKDEFNRKKRNAAFALRSMTYFPSFLFRPSVAWMLWPHKLLRWFSGLLIFSWAVFSFAAMQSGSLVGEVFVVLAVIVVCLAAIGAVVRKGIPYRLWWVAIMSLAGLLGAWDFVRANNKAMWDQTNRAQLLPMDGPAQEVRA